MCKCITDCKNWKEKVFVLRDYIYIYMFGLCSALFRAAAIEKKNCIELYFVKYTRLAKLKTGSRKRIERKYVRFYYRKCVLVECDKNI